MTGQQLAFDFCDPAWTTPPKPRRRRQELSHSEERDLRAVLTVTVETRADGGHYFDQADFAGHVTQWVRAALKGKHAIGEVTITEQPAAASAVVSAPTDQTALRDRIAAKKREPAFQELGKLLETPVAVDVVQGIVFHEAADIAEKVAESLRKQHEFERSTGALDVMTELRRLAAEAAATPPPALTEEGRLRAQVEVLQQDAERDHGLAKVGARCMRDGHQGLIEHGRIVLEGWRFALSTALDLGTGAPWEAIHERVKELTAEAQQQPDTETRLAKVERWVTSEVVTAKTEFGDGYRAALRDVRDVIKGRYDYDPMAAHEPAPVAQQPAAEAWDVPDARPGTTDHTLQQQRQTAEETPVVAYRSLGGRILRCLNHIPPEPDGDFIPVTSDDLPDGGICTYPECGVDVLIPQQPAAGDGEMMRPVLRCNWAHTRHKHTPHDWEPQPGMDPVRCPGYNSAEEPRP